ncbi:DUF1003 domain-containing protein [soil metagenome]
MAREDRRVRLDSPVDTRRSFVRRPAYDPDVFGQLSERIARFLGTGSFLVYMTVFISAWLLWNNIAPPRMQFDPYTHTFLTLLLSIQASYAAPLILLAQNRQEARDRVNMDQDREANARAHADMQFLAREVAGLRMALGEVATRDYLRSELRSLVGDLHELQETERPAEDPAGPPAGEERGAGPGT